MIDKLILIFAKIIRILKMKSKVNKSTNEVMKYQMKMENEKIFNNS